jgi:hypothetical protein
MPMIDAAVSLALAVSPSASPAAVAPSSLRALAAPPAYSMSAPAPSLSPAFAAAALPAAALPQSIPAAAAPVDEPAQKPSASSPALASARQENLSFDGDSPLRDVKVREVVPDVFHLQFPTQHLMTATFMRFQEHYESPEYAGKVFTHKEFARWYAKDFGEKGRFTYMDDWAGFNIPSKVLDRFRAGDFDPLKRKEKDFLALFAGRTKPFYVIGTYGADGDPETLRHEIAHGLYSTRPDYRARALEILKTVALKPVFALIEKLGYHRRSWLDEAHAYLGDDLAYLRKNGIDPAPYAAVHEKLLALYREFAR